MNSTFRLNALNDAVDILDELRTRECRKKRHNERRYEALLEAVVIVDMERKELRKRVALACEPWFTH